MKDTAVVILNFNGRHFLEKFLGGVVQNSPEADIVVVDNCSTDTSVQYIHDFFPHVKVIVLDQNYGFAEGYNRGLENLQYRYFLLLNSDVEVTPNWLAPLRETLQKNLEVATVQPKILDYNRKTFFEYAGAAGGFMDIMGFAFCRGRIFDHLEKDQGQYNTQSEIFWATGACFFVRSDVFKQLGGFDPKFFAHMEEIDLCWRIQNAGFKIMYQPISTVYHVGGGTLNVANPKKTFLNYRNNLMMLFKNLPAVYLFPIIFVRLCLDGISGIRFLAKGELGNLWAVFKSHFAFYAHIPYLLRHRAASFGGFQKLYSGSVVWDYFVKKRKTYPELCSK